MLFYFDGSSILNRILQQKRRIVEAANERVRRSLANRQQIDVIQLIDVSKGTSNEKSIERSSTQTENEQTESISVTQPKPKLTKRVEVRLKNLKDVNGNEKINAPETGPRQKITTKANSESKLKECFVCLNRLTEIEIRNVLSSTKPPKNTQCSKDDNENSLNDIGSKTRARKRPREKRSKAKNIAASKDIFMHLSFEEETPNDVENVTKISAPVVDKAIGTDKPQKMRNKFKWVTHSKWKSLDEAFDFLDNEGFVHYDDSNLKMGQKFYFRCKRTPKTVKPFCALRFTVFLPSHNNEIILLHNGHEHNHNKIMEGKKQMMSDEMIIFVDQLFEKEVFRYSQIIEFIEEQRTKCNIFLDEPNPDVRQIEYRLRKFRNTDIKPIINMGDLMEWCGANAVYPNDDNTAFVLAHESSSIFEALHFQFCLTTPKLLKKFIDLKTICIDATYKLNWIGFPLIVLGTVDRRKQFHPLLYACTSHETTTDYSFVFESVKNSIEVFFEASFEPKTLIADGAMAIRNAFYNVFDSAELDIMCFAHVTRNIRKRPFAMKNNKVLILDDIRKIQSAPSSAIFEEMTKLFCQKWKPLEPNFIEYFESQWLGPLANWFEGAAIYTPSTNNALESHNATIKRKVTLRRRLPLNQFLVAMKELTESISSQFASGQKEIAMEPDVKKNNDGQCCVDAPKPI